MEPAPRPVTVAPPLEAALLAAAARSAADAAADGAEPAKAIDAAVGAFHEALSGVLPSVFVLEDGRLWLVSQRGYAVVPDGITVDRGIMGRAVRLRRAQLVPDVHADRDYVPALPGVGAELAVPLLVTGTVVGALNLESERPLPAGSARAVAPLVAELARHVEALRASALDLAALARLFVQLGSLRDPREIAALAAASLPRVLPVESSHVVLWDDPAAPRRLAEWSAGRTSAPLSGRELETARSLVDSTVVCQLIETGARRRRSLVWLPLRANGEELGVLVGVATSGGRVDPAQLDTAAVLAAHVAASLDAALSLQRERRTAVTDPLTGILNRRGLEQHLDRELAVAQERRLPLSLLVIDCDDLKEINDRAGHEFGDALLREVAQVLTSALPEGAVAARLGGDEFVVMLPGEGADSAEALGQRIRSVLAEGLTDAGFPLRVSAGISTYPFDGAAASPLVRAADQALYAAKNAGKDRVASYRDLVRADAGPPAAAQSADVLPTRRRGGRGDGSAISDVVAFSAAIETEETAAAVCNRLCRALVFFVGATACAASRVIDDRLVGLAGHSLREVWLGQETEYRLDDFPLTAEVLRTGRARAASFLDAEVDRAEAFILRQLGMNAVLMLPLFVRGRPWGLVELYDMRLRRFTEDDVAIARFLTSQAERRLGVVVTEHGTAPPARIYELPSEPPPAAGAR